MSCKFLIYASCFLLPASLAGAGTQAKTSGAEVGEGKKLFAEHCAICHYADRTATKVGPGLKGLFHKKKLKTGATVADSNVRKLIEEGHGGMPAWKNVLSKDQIDDVMAYLKTL